MLKIIEYFKSLGVDANTTATILITIFTFGLGLFFTWLVGYIKSRKVRDSFKKSYIFIFKDFIKSCEKQYKVVTMSLEKTGLGEGKNFIVSYISIGTLDYLNKLDFNVFLQNFEPTFPKRNYSKAISKLFEIISQIKIQHDSMKEFMDNIFKAYKENENKYFENLGNLRDLNDSLILKYKNNQLGTDKEKEFAFEFINVFQKWYESGQNRNISQTHKHVVLEILKLNKPEYYFPLMLDVNGFALKCDMAYQNIDNVTSMLIQKVRHFAHYHRRAAKVTNLIIKIIG